MIDRQRLAPWIKHQHLEDRALEAYKKAFTTALDPRHPVKRR